MADITSRRKLSIKWSPQLMKILGIDTVVGYRDQMKALVQGRHYSTVTDLARFLGQSTLQPLQIHVQKWTRKV